MANYSKLTKDELIKTILGLEETLEIKNRRYNKLLQEYDELNSSINNLNNNYKKEIKTKETEISELKEKNIELYRGIYKGFKEICKGYLYNPAQDETWNEKNFEEKGGIKHIINEIQFKTDEDVIELEI